MKRILVIDESEVVRETLALILGREFIVIKRPHGTGAFFDSESDVDLVILGVTPGIRVESSTLLRFAARAPFAVLFLVDSKTAARNIEDRDKVGCLAKPFNPYELREKVGLLLARHNALAQNAIPSSQSRHDEVTPYLQFPYLSRTAASLVRRFVTTELPLLISGEIGCGQERVARAVQSSRVNPSAFITLSATDITTEYLAEKSLELSYRRRLQGTRTTLVIENVEAVAPAGQVALLDFLEASETSGKWRVLTTARADLLEKVYRGEFLEGLYYTLATLALKLSPLRERREDIPAIASWFAARYAKTLGLGEIIFSPAATERLVNYLWFGNLHEMETVIARTLVIHRKNRMEVSDLVFDWSGDLGVTETPEREEVAPSETQSKEDLKPFKAPAISHGSLPAVPRSENGYPRSAGFNALIHELAHELKNPMVTIKTFAQLLADRYQDENFRSRFQDVVSSDIERMDDLLESMIEFADFSQPRVSKVPLEVKLRSALNEISDEITKRQARTVWKGNGYSHDVLTDEAQLKYILRNVLLAIVSQAKMGSENEIDVEKQGCVALSYLREGARVASITHYLSPSTSHLDESTLPLRILLAKQLLERNGGLMTVEPSNSERETLRMEFPTA
jgi:two-component system response regulator PilR (NtrC family)